jgi:hypothetical protein
MRPLIKRKLFAGLISAAGAAVLAMSLLAAGASAAPNPNEAQATNVPYVAWVGEHVRLVICSNEVTADALKAGVNIQSSQGLYKFYNANFAVEDWSGYQFQPPTPDGDNASQIGQYFDPGPAAFFYTDGKVCIATDYKSLNPGLTRIRLVVKSDNDGEVVFSHQFLVIWLTASKPVLNEAGTSASGTETFQNQLSDTGQSNLSNFLGDKEVNGQFIPSPFSGEETDKGLVQIKVTGSFPVVKEAPLSNILTSSSYTLPEEWKTLAETLSSSSEETEPPGTEPKLWDIHGTPTNDNVSNASSTLGALFAPFSSGALGGFTSGATATVGPYDPQSAEETLISDGEINEYDAPMPAMRIDVSLAPHTSGLGGVGEISGASKALIYSHNFNGDAEEEGNLYNPYYGAYIPATDRGLPQSSGVTGSSPGGDFPGFLNNHPEPYKFWTPLHPTNYRGSSHSTGCLRREGADPSEYETPSNTPQTQTFYTDEHGEAYVTYTPGDGFYLENLPELHEGEEEKAGEIIKNGDGGCDLKLLKGQEIGNSVISARAVYPYEPVDYPAQASVNTLTKTVTSAWEKEWFQFPKGPGANEATVKIIVAKAQDIDGKPFANETVCFVTPNGGTVSHFPGNTVDDVNGVLGFGASSVVVGPSTVVSTGGTNEICEKTNNNGLAAIEVTNSTLKHVDLNVTYTEENIIRDHEVNFVTPAEEKAEKAAKEAKEAKEAAEKTAKEAAATEKAANEAAEKKANEERAKEVSEQKITETQAAEKAAAEKTANEKAEKEANEKRKIEVEAAKVTPVTVTPAAVTINTASGSTTSGSTTSGSTSLLTPAPALSLGTLSGSTASLTEAQKLAKALKACKKLPKSKRAACEAKAKKAYSAKVKKHKK